MRNKGVAGEPTIRAAVLVLVSHAVFWAVVLVADAVLVVSVVVAARAVSEEDAVQVVLPEVQAAGLMAAAVVVQVADAGNNPKYISSEWHCYSW